MADLTMLLAFVTGFGGLLVTLAAADEMYFRIRRKHRGMNDHD